MIFNNLNDLKKSIPSLSAEVMDKGYNVKDYVTDVGKENVQKEVYNVYKPMQYKRTGKLKEEWKGERVGDSLEVFNTRTDPTNTMNSDVAENVITGRNYNYGVPRPFIMTTRLELETKMDELENKLALDFRNSGYDVE